MEKRKGRRGPKVTGLCFIIDKLTHCIQDRETGIEFKTLVVEFSAKEIKEIRKKEWKFDWKGELLEPGRIVYKLLLKEHPDVLQGLVSVEDKKDHIFMHLLESARSNRGKQKKYCGVAGNLVAFACKLSVERGYEGFVAFDAKTVLIPHYEKTLGAKNEFGIRMFIPTEAALRLVEHYFIDNNL